jgi:3-oxoadipate enol-lactonase
MQAECNGVLLSYELYGPEGDVPCLVLSHCLAADMGLWEEQIRELGRFYRVLSYDIRGHGFSSAPEGDYSMEGLAEDLRALLDELGLKRVHFAGISLGGMIGQVFALKHPGYLESLTLCDTTCRVPEELRPLWEERIETVSNRGMEAVVEPTLDRWLTPEFREEQPDATDRIADMIRNTPVSGFAGCCRAISRFDASGDLHAINLPTRVVVGENDPGTPVQEAEAIQQRIPGAELRILSGARHLTCVEAAREFNCVLREILESAEG